MWYKDIRFQTLALVTLFLTLSIALNYSRKENIHQLSGQAQNSINAVTGNPQMTVLAKNLSVPWALGFLPDGRLIFTERPGTVKVLDQSSGQVSEVAKISEVEAVDESGLLGLALHPQFSSNNFIYLYYTYAGSGGNTLNKVVRYTFTNNQLTNPTTIVDAIPGGSFHNGGRLKFGPDGFLYITTGDSGNTSLAPNTNSLAGKILRVTDTGDPAPGNPFNNRVYSYGHRNPQGLAWDQGGQLWGTEHGPSGAWPNCCQDELNKIQIGGNYGWPDSFGDNVESGTIGPVLHSGEDTWAPSGIAFYAGSIFIAGLRGQALYEAVPNGNSATLKTYFKGELKRLRDAVVGPDNLLYIMTSNGRSGEDDRIIRLSWAGQTTPFPTPTFNCLGACPSATPTSPAATTAPTSLPTVTTSLSPTGIIQPSPTPSFATSPSPTTASIATPTQIQQPTSLPTNTPNPGGGGQGGLIGLILQFLLQFLQLLLSIFKR